VAIVEVVMKCDLCGIRVKPDNSDSWAGKLPMKTPPQTKEELEANPTLKRPDYSITSVDICFPCVDALGDYLVGQKR
jgi:hypothetical protein